MEDKEIINGEHKFVFPPNPPNDINLGKCQGPCRMIVTLKEALHRKFGPCVERDISRRSFNGTHGNGGDFD